MANEQHRWIVIEYIVCAISMVHIEVIDHDPLQSHGLSSTRYHCHVRQNAEAHRAGEGGVVARGAYQAKGDWGGRLSRGLNHVLK